MFFSGSKLYSAGYIFSCLVLQDMLKRKMKPFALTWKKIERISVIRRELQIWNKGNHWKSTCLLFVFWPKKCQNWLLPLSNPYLHQCTPENIWDLKTCLVDTQIPSCHPEVQTLLVQNLIVFPSSETLTYFRFLMVHRKKATTVETSNYWLRPKLNTHQEHRVRRIGIATW